MNGGVDGRCVDDLPTENGLEVGLLVARSGPRRARPAGLVEVAGEDAKKGIDEAKKAAEDAVTAANTKATLNNYNAKNH